MSFSITKESLFLESVSTLKQGSYSTKKSTANNTNEKDHLSVDYDCNLPDLETMYTHNRCNILFA